MKLLVEGFRMLCIILEALLEYQYKHADTIEIKTRTQLLGKGNTCVDIPCENSCRNRA